MSSAAVADLQTEIQKQNENYRKRTQTDIERREKAQETERLRISQLYSQYGRQIESIITELKKCDTVDMLIDHKFSFQANERDLIEYMIKEEEYHIHHTYKSTGSMLSWVCLSLFCLCVPVCYECYRNPRRRLVILKYLLKGSLSNGDNLSWV